LGGVDPPQLVVPLRILVIEDESAIAAAVRVALADEGHAVDVVPNGPDGLEWAAAAPYGLIILDVVLGGMSGLEVCRTLRQRGFDQPILMLTALTSVEDRVAGLDRGADDYLGKPFAIAELKARVRALARRPSTGGTATIVVGDLTLEPATLGVRRGGRSIRLTAREFTFLELFARHPGQVFTQEHLVEALWSADAIPGSNVVEVYVRSLRRKLDGGRRDGIIETVRGAGYRLRPPGNDRRAGEPSDVGRNGNAGDQPGDRG
jgi:two-component system OmpR family response regulator